MQHLFGVEDIPWRARRQVVPSVLDTDKMINGHMLVAGMSGTGKSYQIMALLASAHRQGIHVDAFDIHEEFHRAPGAVAAKFSEATRLGYNPLVPSLDIHSGGIRRQIEFVVDLINRAGRLGTRQEPALKNLLMEVYNMRGMYPEKPHTWDQRIITEAEFDAIVDARDYKMLRTCQPILRDVISWCERKLKAMDTGGNKTTVLALEAVEKAVGKRAKLMASRDKAMTDDERKRIDSQISSLGDDAIEAYAAFVKGMETGNEYAEASRYFNPETLRALQERLQGLQDGGIFRSNPPDFGDATTRAYQMKSLKLEDAKLLVYLRCNAILQQAMDAGETDHLRHIVLVDEGDLFYSEDRDNPLNRIAKEGRKYGLGLVIGSQSPTHFSEAFFTNAGTIVLCGIHDSYWNLACQKLGCDRSVLANTVNKEVAAIKMQRAGESQPRFINVNVNRAVVAEAVRAQREQRVHAQEQPA